MPIDQFIIFFLLLLTGFFCKRFGVLTDPAVNSLNMFIINIAYPCLILGRTTGMDMDAQIFSSFMLALFINLGILLLFGVYARLCFRGKRFDGEDRSAMEFASISSNNGFMGFPIALTFFGDLGLLYMIACNIALNAMFFTYGILLLKRGRGIPGEPFGKKLRDFAKMIAHPKLSAAIVGIILCYNGIRLPEIAESYLSIVGEVTTPLVMVSIGTMLAGQFGLSSFKRRPVMVPALNKLFVVPAIAALIVWFLPLDPLVKTIIIISNALPVAAVVPILCEQYGRDKGLAGESLVITTLVSMVTIPLAVWLLGMAWG